MNLLPTKNASDQTDLKEVDGGYLSTKKKSLSKGKRENLKEEGRS